MANRFLGAGALVVLATASASAAGSTLPPVTSCAGLPTNAQLTTALRSAVSAGANNGGLGFNMWASLVANDGTVCAVAFSGGSYTDQWLASRVISAQKASTANSLSLGKTSAGAASSKGALALSTSNLYSAVQEGGSLYGLQFSNPVDPEVAYFQANGGPANAANFGTANDPMVGRPIGGINVFGGGFALYSKAGKIGGVGVSGDTSCTDTQVAWHLRHNLGLDYLKTNGIGGVSPNAATPDAIVYDIPANTSSPKIVGANGVSAGGFGHPTCLNSPALGSDGKTPTGLEPVQ
jgi:uncharacterized protein GlcG (DUF336 family)